MGIIGFTDQLKLRRDGKIRAGKKDGTKLVNTDHFLLHDAPALAGMFGETTMEIYFTVHSDDKDDFLKTDLRLYNASQLLCLSMHDALDENGQKMGSVAAYSGIGVEASGLLQKQFPRLPRARQRICNYTACPDYIQDKCSEHMFLDIIVPQVSMGAIYTLDSVSKNAIMNAESTFGKAGFRYGGKLSGEIYRMYKKAGEIKYQKDNGSQGKRAAPMVHIEMINFEDYEAKFKSSIRPEDWRALIKLRERYVSLKLSENLQLSPIEDLDQLTAPPETSTVGQGLIGAPEVDPVLARANDPAILPYFEKYGNLIGKEPTEKIRIATMLHIPSVAAGITHLKNRIKEAEKAQKATATTIPVGDGTPKDVTPSSSNTGGLY